MTLLNDRRRLVRAFRQWQQEGVEQSAIPGCATFVQGDTNEDNKVILIVQSTTGQRITMDSVDTELIQGLMQLADQDNNQGLVRQIGACKWAFYNTEAVPQTIVSYDPTHDCPAEFWNRQMLSQIDLDQYQSINHLFFAAQLRG
ncbi:hypothetical protein MGN70_009053 [Eutypa lata]|uniref:Uncharacterized protein n=1 Tax=Eutypa lata (strain UCR-EL1) TaxID=1287681 RepID=M7TN61_EUTLA|nr:hypothetical protein UCREL1_1613 [Eutypa lata UCREL1]KAI1249440.1 hypothetical protein MGN70_009053 [Eutypa lata]